MLFLASESKEPGTLFVPKPEKNRAKVWVGGLILFTNRSYSHGDAARDSQTMNRLAQHPFHFRIGLVTTSPSKG